MQVFVSYSTIDKAAVAPIVNELQIAGHQVWWDQNLPPEQLWQENLNQQLVDAQVLCVVLSPNSIESDWVRKEYQFALEQQSQGNMRVIPVTIASCQPPEALAHIQVIDMIDFPKSMWGLTGLLKTLSNDADFLANAESYNGGVFSEAVFNHMPPWQRAIETMLLDDEFYSRSIVTIAMRCNLTVLEATRYCLSANHISLSPYLTPSAQPIPYFGLTTRILKRYKHQKLYYLDAIHGFFNLIKSKKAHREFSECWVLIRDHFATEFDENDQGLVGRLQQQYDKLWLIIVSDNSELEQDLTKYNHKSDNKTAVIMTLTQLKNLPSAILKSTLLAASCIAIDEQVDIHWINFLLGFGEGQSLTPQKYWLVTDAVTVKENIVGLIDVSLISIKQLCELI